MRGWDGMVAERALTVPDVAHARRQAAVRTMRLYPYIWFVYRTHSCRDTATALRTSYPGVEVRLVDDTIMARWARTADNPL